MDEEQAQELADLIPRLFALLTAKLENAATFAADGQGSHPHERLAELSSDLRALIEEAQTLALAVTALLSHQPPSSATAAAAGCRARED